jgi:serine/threonine protein kinase/Tol biopolymer transport system component
MSLGPGTRLGPYEVVSAIGAGGMGEVYRARDTRLKRDVAIKIVPESFAADPERLARFQREAEVLASLSHPNIAGIYGLEESDGHRALVMELVEGDTLADRIARGSIPIDEALPIAKQIAEALEAAHEQGIIHRDLKPANIKVTLDSRVKVLDFGLAKLAEPPTPAGSGTNALSMSPTITSPAIMTGVGVLLGTAAYMSPEQARGRPADKRSDIWAFGCLLFEMLTGRPAFDGQDVAVVLARVLEREPDWSLLPPAVSLTMRRLVRRCVQKDRARRWQSAGDLRVELDEARSEPTEPTTEPTARRASTRERVLTVIATLAVVTAGGVVWLNRGNPAPSPLITRFDVATPPTTTATSFAVSPDGRQLAYVATTEGQSRLWVRPLNETSARALPGTEGATYPFWAPDGHALAFFADGKLKRVDLDGGALRVLADAPTARGGAWSSDDVIVFAPDQGFFSTGSMLMRVSASGGMPIPVTKLAKKERSHRWPLFLPDGRRFLFFSALADPDVQGVYLGSLDATQPKRVFASDASVAFVPPDHFLFVRGDVLMAARFDSDRETIVGEPEPIAQPVGRDGGTFSDMVSASPDVLAYRATGGGQRRQLAWVDRTGNVLSTVGSSDDNSMGTAAIDASGHRIAVTRSVLRDTDVWLIDTTRGIPTRFTFDPAIEGVPVWSPDGRRIVFGAWRGGGVTLYEKSATGAGNERVVAADAGFPLSWSRDGRFVLYSHADVQTGVDLWALPMSGERRPFTLVRAALDQRGGEFSPDGRWLAYESNESGRFEVYVQPFPEAGGKWQASSVGGTQVRWKRDGRELYYVALDGRLMAVSVTASRDGKTLNLGVPVPLFRTRLAVGANVIPGRPEYLVAPDGRFLVNTIVDDSPASPITVVVNWQQVLKRLVPTK